jgi:hypothetical protein
MFCDQCRSTCPGAAPLGLHIYVETRLTVSSKVGFSLSSLEEYKALQAKGGIVTCGNRMRLVDRGGSISVAMEDRLTSHLIRVKTMAFAP